MTFKEQNKAQSMSFICTSNKLPVTKMLSEIVKDLKILEKGVEMFDREFSESVLVVEQIRGVENVIGRMKLEVH
ncbi:hypothetical protein BDF14DRAFT_1885635 [Spinellus fusiger]|nr:hypothetical protein BDF14DRAFT_1885635 [Spinellus fusiger]